MFYTGIHVEDNYMGRRFRDTTEFLNFVTDILRVFDKAASYLRRTYHT